MRYSKIKKLGLGLVATLLFVVVSFAVPKDATYNGEIMDSQCAMKDGHTAMMKSLGMGTTRMCTIACANGSGKYVLYDAATKTTYQLDDQDKPHTFAGAKVQVTGTLDGATKTIHVTAINKAS